MLRRALGYMVVPPAVFAHAVQQTTALAACAPLQAQVVLIHLKPDKLPLIFISLFCPSFCFVVRC